MAKQRQRLTDLGVVGLLFLMLFNYPVTVLAANLETKEQLLAVGLFFLPVVYVVYNIIKDQERLPKHIHLFGLVAASFWLIHCSTQLMLTFGLSFSGEAGAYQLWSVRYLPLVIWGVLSLVGYHFTNKISSFPIATIIKFLTLGQLLFFMGSCFIQVYNLYLVKAGMTFVIQTPDYLTSYLLLVTPLSFLVFFKNKLQPETFRKNYYLSLAITMLSLVLLTFILLSASPVNNNFNFEASYFLDNLLLNYGQIGARLIGIFQFVIQFFVSVVIYFVVLGNVKERWERKKQPWIHLGNSVLVLALLIFSTYMMSVDMAEISEATKLITFIVQLVYILMLVSYGYYLGLKKYEHPLIKSGLYIFPSFVCIYIIYYLAKIWQSLPKTVINHLVSVQRIFLIVSLFVIFYYTFETLMLWIAYSKRKKTIDLGPIAVEQEYEMYVMIPCMNEELVISNTVASILASEYQKLNILVIDDASEDQTAAKVQAFNDPRVRLIQRVKPHAQEGKGEALNYVYDIIKKEVHDRGKSFADVLIAIIDADTLLPEQYFEKVNFVFNNRKEITGLQSKVRVISQTKDSSQDLEFAEIINATQTFRSMMGTVAFGGNGQFCKLSTLDQLSEVPWSKSLVEDFDLSTRLFLLEDVVTRNIQLDDIYITQSGIDRDTPALVKQRVRWSQGNIQSAKYILPIIRSKTMDGKQKLEFMMTLFKPWLMMLEYLIIIYTFVVIVDLFLLYGMNQLMFSIIAIFLLMVLYILAINFVWAWLYNRNKEQRFSLLRVIRDTYYLSKFLLTLSQIYPQATIRHFKSESGWDKTKRQQDLKDNDSTK
ncbi:MAG: glycosyltransferase family 2 protein [Enterococcus sp.]